MKFDGKTLEVDSSHELIELRVRKKGELVKSVELKGKKLVLNLTDAKVYQLKPTMKPGKKALDKEAFYESSNPAVASVDKNGKITANKPGVATITVYSTSMKKAKVEVTVSGPVTKITITNEKGKAIKKPSIKIGETLKLVAKTNADAIDKSVTWQSSDTSVATVSADGTVTALSKGTVKITAVANDGSNIKASVTVKVKVK